MEKVCVCLDPVGSKSPAPEMECCKIKFHASCLLKWETLQSELSSDRMSWKCPGCEVERHDSISPVKSFLLWEKSAYKVLSVVSSVLGLALGAFSFYVAHKYTPSLEKISHLSYRLFQVVASVGASLMARGVAKRLENNRYSFSNFQSNVGQLYQSWSRNDASHRRITHFFIKLYNVCYRKDLTTREIDECATLALPSAPQALIELIYKEVVGEFSSMSIFYPEKLFCPKQWEIMKDFYARLANITQLSGDVSSTTFKALSQDESSQALVQALSVLGSDFKEEEKYEVLKQQLGKNLWKAILQNPQLEMKQVGNLNKFAIAAIISLETFKTRIKFKDEEGRENERVTSSFVDMLTSLQNECKIYVSGGKYDGKTALVRKIVASFKDARELSFAQLTLNELYRSKIFEIIGESNREKFEPFMGNSDLSNSFGNSPGKTP